jgi:hypothetical protein
LSNARLSLEAFDIPERHHSTQARRQSLQGLFGVAHRFPLDTLFGWVILPIAFGVRRAVLQAKGDGSIVDAISH